MNHLSGLDAMFLHIESPEMPMHVGSLNVVKLPAGYAGDYYEDVKAHIASRMHLADLFTRKLALMPFDLSNPVWVDDEDIDLEYHVRHVSLPKPGSNHQLQQYVARLHSSLLDRSRPLWEVYVIDGLRSGEVGIYTKAHHAGIDGQAGVAVGRAIFDVTPTGRVVRPPRARARRNQYQLGVAELAGAALRNTAVQTYKLAKMLPDILNAARSSLIPAKGEDGKRDWKLPEIRKYLAPRTLFNVAITNQRTFAGRTISLAETKFIGKRLGATLNDVVMATVAGALSRYLREYDNLPEKSLVAAIPMSLRAEGDTTANNQVSMATMTLATDTPDRLERLKKIHASSATAKAALGRFKAAIPTDFPMLGAPWLISGAASLYGRSRLANIIPPIANVAISNVPGPNVPLYFAGAEVASYYPVSIPGHGIALNITVQSYNGRLDYGLTACRRTVPDLGDIGDFMLDEHKKLLDLAQAQPEAAPQIATTPEPVKTGAKPKAPSRRRVAAAPQLKLVADSVSPAVAPARSRKRAVTA